MKDVFKNNNLIESRKAGAVVKGNNLLRSRSDEDGGQRLFGADGGGISVSPWTSENFWLGITNAQNGLLQGIASIWSAANNKSQTTTYNENRTNIDNSTRMNLEGWVLWGGVGAVVVALVVTLVVVLNKRRGE